MLEYFRSEYDLIITAVIWILAIVSVLTVYKITKNHDSNNIAHKDRIDKFMTNAIQKHNDQFKEKSLKADTK